MVTNLNVLPNGNEDADHDEGEFCSRKEGRCGNGLEKIYPTTAVRYGYMNYIGEFTHRPEMKFGCGVKVVIKSSRGIEIGQQVSLTCSGCDQSVSREQIQTYIRNSGPEYYQLDSGRILREATPDDLREDGRLREGTHEKEAFCQTSADRLTLPIKVVACEHLFGGERIVYYFLSEGRVDFRTLVRELAAEYQTRIEMRQVGVRDEARLLADYETCGRECCCKNFLKTLRPVNMKMAKMQKATLDPSKVSGRCGRLKCCLRYEHETYEELDGRLPQIGQKVSTAHGEGIVVNRQILTQLIQVRKDDGVLFSTAIEDVFGPDGRDARRPDRAPPSAEPWAFERREAEADDAGYDVREDGRMGPVDRDDPTDDRGAQDSARRRRRRRRRGPGGPGGPETPPEARSEGGPS